MGHPTPQLYTSSVNATSEGSTLTDLEPGDRPITIYACLPARYREHHDRMIMDMMKALRDIYPECTFDWEETP